VNVNLLDEFDKRAVRLLADFAIVVLASTAFGQLSKPTPDPLALVRRASANEIKAETATKFFIYKDTEQSKSRTVTKEVIQTPQGGLSRTIAINGRALTAAERAKDDQDLRKYANDPEARRKRREHNKEEDQRAQLMLTSLPDAFLYTYAGPQPGPNGYALIHLTFQPNPKFQPPNHETAVYLGMQGDILIDPKAMRIAKIDGTLVKDVNFGWGILGKLDKGGKFVIEQRDVGGGHWEQIREKLQFTGRILMLKSLDISSDETMTDFREVPANLTAAQALEMLYKGDEVVAENGGGVKEAENHRK
jgi:hypothetical protein